jgi:hypothetical protein
MKGEKIVRLFGATLIVLSLSLYILGFFPGGLTGFGILLLLLGGYFYRFGHFYIPREKSNPNNYLSSLLLFMLFFMVVFFYQFLFLGEFGLYENDFYLVAPAFDWSFGDLIRSINHHLFYQFSPDSFPIIFIQFFSFLGYRTFGLPGIYLLACLIVTGITYVIFIVCRKLFWQDSIAFLGAILYVVFPPVMFPQLIHLVFSKQIGLLFFLISLLFYLGKKKMGFEVFMISTLFFFREFLIFFLFFPLVNMGSSSKLRFRDYLDHVLRIGIISSVVIIGLIWEDTGYSIFRDYIHFFLLPITPIKVFIEGGFHFSLQNFAHNPTLFMKYFSPILLLGFLLIFGFYLIFLLICKKKNITEDPDKRREYQISNPLFSFRFNAKLKNMRSLFYFFVGLFLFINAYSGYPDYVYLGIKNTPTTWIHFVIVFPILLIFCSLVSFVYEQFRKRFTQTLFVLAIIGCLGFFGAARLHNQQNTIRAWHRHQWLWTNIISKMPVFDQAIITKVNLMSDVPVDKFDDGSSIYMRMNLFPVIFEAPGEWEKFPEITFSDQMEPQYDDGEMIRPTIFFRIQDGYLILDPNPRISDLLLNTPTSLSLDALQKKQVFSLVFNGNYTDVSFDTLE